MSEPEVSEPAPARRVITLRRVGIALAALFVLYLAAGFFIVPIVVESQLASTIEQQTGTRPTVEDVRFDPLRWRLVLTGFAMPDPDTGEKVVGFESLVVDVAVVDLLFARLELDELALVAPTIEAVIDETGKLNLAAFAPDEGEEVEPESEPESSEDEERLVVQIDWLRIERGALRFEDRMQTPAFELAIEPLDLEFTHFTTRAGGESQYALRVGIGEETELRWDGSLGLDPLGSTGRIELDRFDLEVPWDYLSDRLAFEVAGGELDARASYVLAFADGLSLDLDEARVDLRDAAVRDPAIDEAVVLVPAFSVTGIAAHVDQDGLARLDIDAVELEGGHARSHLSEDGELRLATLLTPVEAEPPAAEPETPPAEQAEAVVETVAEVADEVTPDVVVEAANEVAEEVVAEAEAAVASNEVVEDPGSSAAPDAAGDANSKAALAAADTAAAEDDDAPGGRPAIRVERVAVRGFEIAIEDRSAPRPVSLVFSPIDLTASGYSSAPGSEIEVELESGFGEGGRLAIRGPVTPDPLATTLAVELDAIPLGPLQPYVDDFARLDVPSGLFAASLEVDVREAGGAAPAISVRGRLQLDDLLTVDRRLERSFLEWSSLRVEGLDYSSGAPGAPGAPGAATDSASGEPSGRVRIDEIGLADAQVHLVVSADGRTNLDAIFGGETTGEGAAERANPDEASAGPLRVEIAAVRLDGVGADLDDLSIEPHFEVSLDDLTGTIEGLSSERNVRARVALVGKIDQVAPVRVSGEINPLAGVIYTDVRVDVEGVSLPAFTPYSGRYVGYAIDRGKLRLDLEYELADRHLEASNRIHLDQFAFGRQVESESATSLPVRLAVAVMRGPQGDIDIALPIAGDLDDPSFSVFGLLGKALVNVVTRVATSPFAALAGLAGASGEELSKVAFAAGSPRLSETEQSELASLVPMLADRPALNVEVRGRADPVAEQAGLRREKIQTALRQAVWEQLSGSEREALDEPSALVLDPQQRRAGLDRLARERLGKPAVELVAAEALPPPGPERDRVVANAALEALAARVELTEADWRSLALARGAAIQGALLASAQLSPDRVFLVDVKVGSVAEGDAVTAVLELSAD